MGQQLWYCTHDNAGRSQPMDAHDDAVLWHGVDGDARDTGNLQLLMPVSLRDDRIRNGSVRTSLKSSGDKSGSVRQRIRAGA
jgi:hypothetical protein